MAKIKKTDVYPIKQNPKITDYIIGTDYENFRKTKNFLFGDVVGTILGYLGIQGPANEWVYQEGVEWNYTNTANVFPIDESSPIFGSRSVLFSNAVPDNEIIFTRGGPKSTNFLQGLSFFVLLQEDLTPQTNKGIEVLIHNGTTLLNTVLIENGMYGFHEEDTTLQEVFLPIPVLGIDQFPEFDSITIRNKYDDLDAYIDNIKLSYFNFTEGVSDNKWKVINFGWNIMPNDLLSVAGAINFLDPVVPVAEDEIPVFTGVMIRRDKNLNLEAYAVHTYIPNGYGKGTYGLGGSIQLQDSDLFLIEEKLTDGQGNIIDNDPNAHLEELGIIPNGTDFWTYINGQGFTVAAGEHWYFSFTQDGVDYLYAYVGGAGPITTSVQDDYVFIESSEQPSNLNTSEIYVEDSIFIYRPLIGNYTGTLQQGDAIFSGWLYSMDESRYLAVSLAVFTGTDGQDINSSLYTDWQPIEYN